MNDAARITIKGEEKRNPVLKQCFVILDRIPNEFNGTKILKCLSPNETTESALKYEGKTIMKGDQKRNVILKECFVILDRITIDLKGTEAPQYMAPMEVKQEFSSKEPIEQVFNLQRTREDSISELKPEIHTSDEFFGGSEDTEFLPPISQVKQEFSSKKPIEEVFKLNRTREDLISELKPEIHTSDEFFGDSEETEFLPPISQVKQELSSKGKQYPIDVKFKLQGTGEDLMPEIKPEVQTSDEFYGDSEDIEFLPPSSQVKQELSSQGKQQPIDEQFKLQRTSNEDPMHELIPDIQTRVEFYGDCDDVEFMPPISQISEKNQKLCLQDKLELSSKGKQEPIDEEFNLERTSEDLMPELKPEIHTSNKFFGDSEDIQFIASIITDKLELSSKWKQKPIDEEFNFERTRPSGDSMPVLKPEIYTSDEFFRDSDSEDIKFIASISPIPKLTGIDEIVIMDPNLSGQKSGNHFSSHCDIPLIENRDNIHTTSHSLTCYPNFDAFNCTRCKLYFCSEKGFNAHILTVHEKNKQFECLNCDSTFSSYKGLLDHNKSCNKILKQRICSICEMVFSKKSDFLNHIKSKKPDKSLKSKKPDKSLKSKKPDKSPYCDYSCCLKSELLCHIKSIHETKNKNGLIPISPKPVHENVFNLLKCSNCNYASKSKSDLQKHCKSIHEISKPFKCPHCEYTCMCKKELSRHIITVHKELKHIMCSNCELSFSSMADLYKHKKMCPFICPYCDYSCRFKVSLLDHINLIHETLLPPFICLSCNYASSSKVDLNKHIKLNHRKIKLVCNYCDRKFIKKERLLKHIKLIHENVLPPIKCVSGNYASSNKKGLKIHKKSAHMPRQIELGCYYCNYASSNKKDLEIHVKQIHIKSSLNPRRIELGCNYCNYICSNKINLQIHIKSAHRPVEIKLICNYCHLKFCELEHLLDHKKLIHETSKSCQCLHCEFTCTGIIELSRHIITVHKELEHFKCPNCELVFSNKADLSHHMKTYPFMCPYCDYSFRFESALSNHLGTVHGTPRPLLFEGIPISEIDNTK